MSTALVQQLDRFQGAHRYHGRQPLAERVFLITVWRAPLIEEDRREQLVQARIPWGAKVPSPQERLEEMQQWIRNAATRPLLMAAGGGGVDDTTGSGGGVPPMVTAMTLDGDIEMTAPPPMRPTPRLATEGVTPSTSDLQQRVGGGDALRWHPVLEALRAAAGTNPVGNDSSVSQAAVHNNHEAAPPVTGSMMQRVIEYCARGEHAFFTRPASEDFVDPTEFISPVEPQQATSPLAAIVLSNHRTQHRGNPNMHLMWAVGATSQQSNNSRRLFQSQSSTTASPFASQLPLEVCDLGWGGEEFVFCTISREANSDTSFLAKPSLNEEHTMLVTTKHVYTFRVTVETSSSSAGANGGFAPTVTPRLVLPGSAPGVSPVSGGRSPFIQTLLDPTPPTPALAAQVALAHTMTGDASERERRTFLRQAVLRGGKGSGSAASTVSAAAIREFTPPPSVGDGTASNPVMKRVHVFGTVEVVLGIHVDSLVLRMRWLLPPGASFDQTAAPGQYHESSPTSIVSQLAFGCRIENTDYAYDTQHTLNLPFDIHVVMPADGKRDIQAIFTVYSRGNGGDDDATAEGYGSAWFSTQPGMRRKESVGLWKPRRTGYEYLRSIFLGGGPSLAEEDVVGLPSHPTNCTNALGGSVFVSSKAGLVCESSGSVHFGYAVVVHHASTTASGASHLSMAARLKAGGGASILTAAAGGGAASEKKTSSRYRDDSQLTFSSAAPVITMQHIAGLHDAQPPQLPPPPRSSSSGRRSKSSSSSTGENGGKISKRPSS